MYPKQTNVLIWICLDVLLTKKSPSSFAAWWGNILDDFKVKYLFAEYSDIHRMSRFLLFLLYLSA